MSLVGGALATQNSARHCSKLVRVSETQRWNSGASAVEDVALGVERHLAIEAADSARPRHDPGGIEFRLVRRSGWTHDQLLETVFEAATARVAAADLLCSILIDGCRQRLFATGFLVDWASTKCPL